MPFVNIHKLLPLALVALFLSSCDLPFGNKRPVAEQTPEYNTPTQASAEAAELVKHALVAAGRLESAILQTAMKADSKKDDFSFRCKAQIIVKRPDRLRLAATKGLGMEVMLLTMIGSSLDVWLPRDHTLYRGRVEDLSRGGMDFHPEEIVQQILLPAERLSGCSWAMLDRNEERAVVLELSPTRHRNRLLISLTDGALLQRDILLPDGEVMLSVAYSRHAPLPDGPEDELLARKIAINFPKDNRNLLLVIRDIVPNPELKSGDFRIMLSDPEAKVMPFSSKESVYVTDSIRAALDESDGAGQ